jgi:predicted transcriptional regulator
MIAAVRSQLLAKADASEDAGDLAQQQNDEVEARILRSGRTNASRAVSDLVRAGLLHRHYQGYRVDHPNRGAQREAVYTIAPDVRLALASGY